MKEKDIRDALFYHGKKRGVIFFEELEDVFPADHFPIGEMEDLLERLDDLGVAVCSLEEWERARRRARRKAA
jgi:hypothetical protein